MRHLGGESDRERIAHLEIELAALRAEVETLRALVRRSSRRRGPGRDQHDRAVLDSLALIVGPSAFRASDVLRRGQLDVDFGRVLVRADKYEVGEIGYLLRSFKGKTVGGARLEYGGRGLWQFVPDRCGIAQPW